MSLTKKSLKDSKPLNFSQRGRKSIKLDRVNPSDFNHFEMIYCCQQCSHYDSKNQICVLGFPSDLHQRGNQLQRLKSHSHMAFCRFLEID